MKSIKRCAKQERKYEQDSDSSSDRQGMYYQFLIERKVPKGTLRHIASLINVTYEFIPDNYQCKRQKVEEKSEFESGLSPKRKENISEYANLQDNTLNGELNALQNLELKTLEDKPKRKKNPRDSEFSRKGHLIFESLPYNGPELKTKENTETITICKKSRRRLAMQKSNSYEKKRRDIQGDRENSTDFAPSFLKNQKIVPCNLKMGSHKKEKCSNPSCNANAKYFITYVNKRDLKPNQVFTDKDRNSMLTLDIPMKRSKSMHYFDEDDALNHDVKRNPKVKYVKAEVFRKHERIRDQQFEDKISELVHHREEEAGAKKSSYIDNPNFNFQRTLMENSKGIEDSDEESVEEKASENGEFTIAQNYGSFDDGENRDSIYSSMQGDSIPGDFDFEVVGSKIELPKLDGLAKFEDDADRLHNASQMGSKITFGEPSGDVFGLTFDNNCNGIFQDDGNHEFLPINTLQTDN